MAEDFEKIKDRLPRLRGLIDDRVDRELYMAFLRVYEFIKSESRRLEQSAVSTSEVRTQQIIEKTTELVNNFATKLIKGTGNGNNPLQQLGSGTVTSVNASGNSLFSVSGGPITESGTFTFTLSSQGANTIFAGPATGAATIPTFRAIVKEDINIPFKLTTSTAADPTTTEYPLNTWGVHLNTTSGNVFIAFNNAGVIVKLQLV